ncbi:MAG TPA: hypothetical protein VF230_15895 [Acidimicrobiales bacterium]
MGVGMTVDPNPVSGYWTHWRLSTSNDPDAKKEAQRDWWWAWEAVDGGAIDANADGVADLLVALADAVPGDEAALAYLGAGPVETLLRNRGGELSPKLLDRLEGAARRNPNFRIAVRCVWWGDDDDPAVVARFQKFAPPL